MAVRFKIVEVIWEDACSSDPWTRSREVLDRLNCVTVGYLLKRDAEALHLAASLNESGQRSSTWRIPVGMVRKVRVLDTVKHDEIEVTID